MDQHVLDYYDYLAFIDWMAATRQQKAAEDRFLDNGGFWI
jgi:hypothetical protein